MNTAFNFVTIGTQTAYRTLVHDGLFREGIKHGFVTNELNLKACDLTLPFSLDAVCNISLAKQVHGKAILSVKDLGTEGDAFLVKLGEACGVRTADCVPLILISRCRSIGAVVHAGWQGACIGIVEDSVSRMKEAGIAVSDLSVYIGPSALDCCYEVGEEVANRFSSGKRYCGGKIYLSIPEYLKNLLMNLGVLEDHIFCAEVCTICSNDFFSYRKNSEDAGRFLTYLAL